MLLLLRRVAVIIGATAISAGTVAAQSASPVSVTDTASQDTAARNVVTAFAIKSGKLVLSSAAHPKPVHLADGTYTNQAGVILVVVDGEITRIQESTGGITEVSSIRLNRQRIIRVMPSTTALMTVSDMPLPSGTFTSEDGRSSFTIVYGRPTAFTLPGVLSKTDQK
jgi:hypothetical protein